MVESGSGPRILQFRLAVVFAHVQPRQEFRLDLFSPLRPSQSGLKQLLSHCTFPSFLGFTSFLGFKLQLPFFACSFSPICTVVKWSWRAGRSAGPLERRGRVKAIWPSRLYCSAAFLENTPFRLGMSPVRPRY